MSNKKPENLIHSREEKMNYLAKYKPETSIFEAFDVDQALPRTDLAFRTWEALLLAKRSHDGLFLVIGKLLKDVRDQKLFEDLDYENFTQFLASEELGFSREKAYMCIKTYEYYIEFLELDPEHIGQMNISKLSMMVPVLKEIEDKTEAVKKIEELSGLRHGDFVREIKKSTDKVGKPNIYYNNELDKWVISYYEDTCVVHSLGNFHKDV